MKIITTTASQKEPAPKGKLTLRFVASRAVYQLYAGGRYVYGVSGGTPEDALDDFEWLHETPTGFSRDDVEVKH